MTKVTFSSAYTAELPASVIAMTTASIAALLLFFLIHILSFVQNMESIKQIYLIIDSMLCGSHMTKVTCSSVALSDKAKYRWIRL